MSKELRSYLLGKDIAYSRTTPYHPMGNAQCERYNGILWKAMKCALKSRNLNVAKWETVVPTALDSVRSLLCTSTGETPHSRFLSFARRSSNGKSLPEWLCKPGPVLLRKFVRTSKTDDLAQRVELIEANPTYARIRYPDGRESNISLRDLARCPREEDVQEVNDEDVNGQTDKSVVGVEPNRVSNTGNRNSDRENDPSVGDDKFDRIPDNSFENVDPESERTLNSSHESSERILNNTSGNDQRTRVAVPRRSIRSNKGVPPDRFGGSVYYD